MKTLQNLHSFTKTLLEELYGDQVNLEEFPEYQEAKETIERNEQDRDLLHQAVVNQLEKDLDEEEYDPIECLLEHVDIVDLIEYLSDEIKDEWLS